MGISLYEHNGRAYRAAHSMLMESGRAAVIHPTGTGKSFIGFKLCEDYPASRVCWLSPSEYIFRTQLENLTQSGAEAPGNVTFLTYAKLALLGGEEIAQLRPDFIVLDEFHRCGAEQWGRGVQALLAAYPAAGVLGLSATNIRYLDNQRDMAEELFEGNVASEMTLGEAIVRGILAPPKYVLSVFAYQKELERYQARVRQVRSAAARDKAERVLEALRRALENADGLDTVFQKHLPDRQGRYLAFCAGAEHMDEMISHVPEWFSGIDPAPHVYRAYSEDPAARQEFARFKADGSAHLKLLFSIDMLNEGIHVEDVSGVILFRPTVSPIVYKQQIGRALSAGKSREPVIFDIVNNIENLYSVGAVEEEMRAALTYYRCRGDGERVTERFRIIDEVRDCRRLFEALNETLTAPWEEMYGYAKRYYAAHGDLNVPRRYRTEEGYALGQWIATQRKVRSGLQYGNLGEERIAKLDAVGMVWESRREQAWQRYYAAAKAYRERYGDLEVPAGYVTAEGLALGRWISNLRTYKKNGVQTAYLTKEREAELEALGMVWSVPDYCWGRNYNAALEYHREHGDLDVPAGYVSRDGVRLGSWLGGLRRQRKKGGQRLTAEQEKQLEELGMVWEDRYQQRWERGYAEAVLYKKEHGDLNVPAAYVSGSGFPLGGWLRKHMPSRVTGKTEIKVTPERRAKLAALGLKLEKGPDPWETRYALAKAYYEAHGNLNVPGRYVADGVWLGKWLNEQKQIYRGGRRGKALTAEQVRRLESIGVEWTRGRRRPRQEERRDSAAV